LAQIPASKARELVEWPAKTQWTQEAPVCHGVRIFVVAIKIAI